MRTAGLGHFRRLWGRIEEDLLEGSYLVKIENINLCLLDYDVESFRGSKSIIVSNSGSFGGKNNFLAICFFLISAVCFVIAIFFAAKSYYIKAYGQLIKED